MENKNSTLLESFCEYCKAYPNQRFWQALRNWSGFNYIWASNKISEDPAMRDTFFYETKNGRKNEKIS